MIVTISGEGLRPEEFDDLEEDLIKALSGIGEFDGHEIATDGSKAKFYIYGPDARQLFEVACPVFKAGGFGDSASVYLRFGEAANLEAPEMRFLLGEAPDWH